MLKISDRRSDSYAVPSIIFAVILSTYLFIDNQIGDVVGSCCGEHSHGGYNVIAILVSELVVNSISLIFILGFCYPSVLFCFGALAIGLAPALIDLISISVINKSVNLAHNISLAIFGAWAIGQL
ncbi:hypothetical protein SAMN04487996_10616 [Dyadobacter soli]|uniref:Uncharacterized protein n=1 Tax=Dyadobacter soli TaxID=659014 RepID=A0A1G7EBN1_9BACT|nr:hypothetical protein [Dyadobacter soli]SDE61081.1 hypothetical protein SAMN04487996_10616 [Dyadobacter soli]